MGQTTNTKYTCFCPFRVVIMYVYMLIFPDQVLSSYLMLQRGGWNIMINSWALSGIFRLLYFTRGEGASSIFIYVNGTNVGVVTWRAILKLGNIYYKNRPEAWVIGTLWTCSVILSSSFESWKEEEKEWVRMWRNKIIAALCEKVLESQNDMSVYEEICSLPISLSLEGLRN